MAQTHSPMRSADESPSGATGSPVCPSILISAMSVSWSLPMTRALQAAAVRQLDGDPVGAVDDVVVRQDAAVGVDDEAGAGAAPGRIVADRRSSRVVAPRPESRTANRTSSRRRFVGAGCASGCASRQARRVDADDGGVDALDDVGEIDGRRRAARPGAAPRAWPASVGAGTGDIGRPAECLRRRWCRPEAQRPQ